MFNPKQVNYLIITIAICLSFVVNSILLTQSATRRSADDLVKIGKIESKDSKDICIEKGGIPIMDGASKTIMIRCDFKTPETK